MLSDGGRHITIIIFISQLPERQQKPIELPTFTANGRKKTIRTEKYKKSK